MKYKMLPAIFLIAAAAIFASAEKITFSADSMSGVSGKNSDRTMLTGNANIKADEMEISADTIELYGSDFRFMKASGNIKGTNSQSKLDFTCSSMTYDRISKIAVLRNAVHLIDKENNVTADAELIEFNQNTEVAVMQINVYLVQDKNTCTAAHAVYHKKQQLLDMSGNPQVVQNQDVFRAQEISLNLKTDEITLDGHVRGSVTTKDSSKSGNTESAAKKDDGKAESKDSEGTKDSSSKEAQAGKADDK
ncbi:MAG: organic solvent tolerance protein OstA, partial [Treponema sp.]|nr:organic solvent tolerance protein OstA [Treponema sp.]